MPAFLKVILQPFSLIYGIITWIRNLLYDVHILSAKEFDVKIISVGNLSVGGTGKTPHVDYLISLFKDEFNISTLSRGYGRKSSGFVLANDNSNWQEIGDEPCLYKHKHQAINVAVDANRRNGIIQLKNKIHDLQMVLLDDAFQHRSVKAGISIVLSDYNNLYMYDTMLPSGSLREFKSGIRRADIIIVTKTPENLAAIEKRRIIKDISIKPYQQLYFSYLTYKGIVSFKNDAASKHVADIKNTAVLMFTGIANNSSMQDYLKSKYKKVEVITFSDHHKYSVKDLQKIENTFNDISEEHKIIVTTEKDFMRLRKQEEFNTFVARLPMYYLPIEVEFHQPDKEEFNNQILKYARANKINSNTLEKYR